MSDRNDQKTQDMSDKAIFVCQKRQKNAGYVRQKIVCVLLVFPLKTQIIPIRIHEADVCTLLLSSNVCKLESYVAQLPSVLYRVYYVLNKMDV